MSVRMLVTHWKSCNDCAALRCSALRCAALCYGVLWCCCTKVRYPALRCAALRCAAMPVIAMHRAHSALLRHERHCTPYHITSRHDERLGTTSDAVLHIMSHHCHCKRRCAPNDPVAGHVQVSHHGLHARRLQDQAEGDGLRGSLQDSMFARANIYNKLSV